MSTELSLLLLYLVYMMYKTLHSCSSYIGQLIEIVESGMQRIISGLGSLMVSHII